MSEPIVNIQQGALKGKIDEDVNGGKFYSFLGIPYGKAPVGELRFKAPLPAESWTGVRDATELGSASVSKHMMLNNFIGSEDCLNLNIFTPQLKNASKPVMVFIHGGGFTQGSNSTEIYGPEFLIINDIVLVCINYRLGILGFLSLNDTSLGVPGNAGLKDMVLALQWIQRNIAQFGGDPNNVTIFGESAGSAACHYLLLSSKAKGLFHRAILQSGVAINPWATGSRSALLITKSLNHDCKSEKEALDILKTLPAEKFFEIQEIVKDVIGDVSVARPFGPVIEKPNPDAFLTEDPITVMMSGNYNKVPVIIGYTDKEGLLFELLKKLHNADFEYRMSNFEKAIPIQCNIEKGSNISKEIAKNIEEFYYKNSKSTEEDIEVFYDFHTDIQFLRGIYITLRTLLKTIKAPVYFYRFAVDTNLNLFKKFGGLETPGACHADDIGYLFKSMMTPAITPNSIEDVSIYRLTKLWTNFAKTGNPNPTDKDNRINVNWVPTTAENLECLEIGNELKLIQKPNIDRMLFWDNIAHKCNCKL